MPEVLIVDDNPQSRAAVVHVLARRCVRGVVVPSFESAHRALDQRGRWRGFLVSMASGTKRQLAGIVRAIESQPGHRRTPVLIQPRIDHRHLVRFAFEAQASCIDDDGARMTVVGLAIDARLTPALHEVLASYVGLRPSVDGEMTRALAAALDVTENTVKSNLRAVLAKLRAVGAPSTMAAIDRWIRRGAPRCPHQDDAFTRGG